jgi:hypothetical protein
VASAPGTPGIVWHEPQPYSAIKARPESMSCGEAVLGPGVPITGLEQAERKAAKKTARQSERPALKAVLRRRRLA